MFFLQTVVFCLSDTEMVSLKKNSKQLIFTSIVFILLQVVNMSGEFQYNMW